MKKIVLSLVAILSMTTAMAQNDEKNGQNGPQQFTPEQRTEMMAKKLNLSDDQKKKVLELNNEYKDVMGGPGGMRGQMGQRGQRGQNGEMGQMGQRGGNRQEMTDEQKAEMKQRMEKGQEYNKKMKEILTDDQYKTYQQMQPQRGGRGNRGGQRGGNRSENNNKD